MSEREGVEVQRLDNCFDCRHQAVLLALARAACEEGSQESAAIRAADYAQENDCRTELSWAAWAADYGSRERSALARACDMLDME